MKIKRPDKFNRMIQSCGTSETCLFTSKSLGQLWSVVNRRRGQGIQNITRKINKPKMALKTFYIPFLFKPVKRMDSICIVQFLYYESMMRILCPKLSSFYPDKPSMYSRNIIGILIKPIFFGGVVFLQSHNNVIFTANLHKEHDD